MGDINYRDVGERINELRMERDYSMEELAELLDVSRQTLSKWINQGKTFELENALKLCDVLGCDMDYLIYGNDSNGYKDKKKQIAGELLGLSPEAIDNLISMDVAYKNNVRSSFHYVSYRPTQIFNKLLSDHSAKLIDFTAYLCELINGWHVVNMYSFINKHYGKYSDVSTRLAEKEYYAILYEFQTKISQFIEKIDHDTFFDGIERYEYKHDDFKIDTEMIKSLSPRKKKKLLKILDEA